MMPLIQSAARQRTISSSNNTRRVNMKWETPQAIDIRFGMEITMYIANR